MIALDSLRKDLQACYPDHDLLDLLTAADAAFRARHGDLGKWQEVIRSLPKISAPDIVLNQPVVRIGREQDCSEQERSQIRNSFRELMPWRKGPFEVFGIHIDTEWRSDWKWQRLHEQISPLQNKRVLDVGCGSGYHCLRMAGDGAALTLGIEPGLLYISQFYALRHFTGEIPVHLLPLTLEAFPKTGITFDTVFSMGVLYHRRSPFDHLMKLKSLMSPGAELVLETLILNRDDDSVLVPENRYAQMRNVWFIPTPPVLASWLKRCGFQNIRCADITKTTVDEQRPTAWMTYESLPEALNPQNPDLTLENLPAPCRAIFICNAG